MQKQETKQNEKKKKPLNVMLLAILVKKGVKDFTPVKMSIGV